MFRFLIEGIHLLLLYGFYYLITFLIFILGVVYLIQDNQRSPSPELPPSTFSEPIRIQRSIEICPRVDGCPIIDGVCLGCRMEERN